MQQGAHLVLVPAEWPARRVEHWRLLLRARAVENQYFVAGCNRAGGEPGAQPDHLPETIKDDELAVVHAGHDHMEAVGAEIDGGENPGFAGRRIVGHRGRGLLRRGHDEVRR